MSAPLTCSRASAARGWVPANLVERRSKAQR